MILAVPALLPRAPAPDPRGSTDPQSTWDPGPGLPSTPWLPPGRPLPRGVGPPPLVQPSQPSATLGLCLLVCSFLS